MPKYNKIPMPVISPETKVNMNEEPVLLTERKLGAWRETRAITAQSLGVALSEYLPKGTFSELELVKLWRGKIDCSSRRKNGVINKF